MDDLLRRAVSVVPSERQLNWQRLEFTGFLHFGVNTFTDREWGDGTEDPAIFTPVQLDAHQWATVCRDAGMRGLIVTAKHHDGFCLWPSRYTEHSVRHSPWRNGRGDVIAELAQACRDTGLKLGIYLSPWDRNSKLYGTPEYNDYFKNQLRELLTNYGEIYCVWLDGACGEGPNGKRQVYDWEGYYEVVRALQPGAVISICGPDVRWCGNEAGHTRESEWSVVPASLQDREKIAERSQKEDTPEFARQVDTRDADLGSREKIRRAGPLVWYPAEVDTSIRPGWFYHAAQDDKVKSLAHLLDIYYGAVGGNAVLLLNVPPDRRGLIHEVDAERLRQMGRYLRETYSCNLAEVAVVTASETRADPNCHPSYILDRNPQTYWAPNDGTEATSLELTLPHATTFDRVMLQENVTMSQRIEGCAVDVWDNGAWRECATATVVGYKRLLRFLPVTTDRVRVRITASRICPTLTHVGLYRSAGI